MLVAKLYPQVVALVEYGLLLDRLSLARLALEHVDVVDDVDEIVGHGLKGELVQEWRDGVEAAVEYEQLRLVLLAAVAHGRIVGLVLVELLLHEVGELDVGLMLDAVAHRRILAERGAQSGYLLGEALEVAETRRMLRVVEDLKGLDRVEREHLALVG